MAKIQCCEKLEGVKKGPWTPEEDHKLIDYIKKHGHGRWRTLPKNAGLKRCGKSCRLRWTNYLRPDIKRGRFSFEEEETIIQLHSVLGNKWSAIAGRLPGRTDNEIKNYWNTHIRKRLLKMGIDPITHTPRLDLLELSSLLNSTLNNSSHQNPNFLFGNMGPLASQNLINLATTLLSYHPKSSTTSNSATTSLGFVPQNNELQENLALLEVQHVPQNQFPSFQKNQFQNPTIREEIQTCETITTSNGNDHHINVPYLNETQLIQAKIDQLSQTLMTSYSSNNSTTSNMWQNNVQADDQALFTPSENSLMADNNCGYQDSTQSSPITSYTMKSNQAFVSSYNSNNATNTIANTSYNSLLSTPSSSPYGNYCCSTSQEEGRDIFCNNMFMYDIGNFAL